MNKNEGDRLQLSRKQREPVAWMERSGIQDRPAGVLPDCTAFHPGYKSGKQSSLSTFVLDGVPVTSDKETEVSLCFVKGEPIDFYRKVGDVCTILFLKRMPSLSITRSTGTDQM